jgi:formylglycine-generating enzyme required for sulfatase activity
MDKPRRVESREVVEGVASALVADPQIVRLSASAAELCLAIRRANALPPGFPEEEMVALAEALQDAPVADVDARLEAAIYVRERFVDCRRRFVTEAPDDPELPSIDAVAHCMNDTIAELSTLMVAAGREAERRALPDRTAGTSVVASEAAGSGLVEVQRQAEDASEHIHELEGTLQSTPISLRVDLSRHYHFLNFSISIEQLKLSVKLIGAIFRGALLDRAWLDKLIAGLNKARAKFEAAWEAAQGFLEQFRSIVDAVRRVSRDLADLIDFARRILRRLFRGRTTSHPAGTVFRDIDAPWCPEMVVIPSGEFLMGSSNDDPEGRTSEKPQHLVRIAYPFAIGRYPVTFDEYEYFARAVNRERNSDEGMGRGRKPVINVSWWDAKAYVAWLSEEAKSLYRLSSEAEWEYSCRAGTQTRYSCGDEIALENANYRSHLGRTTEVAAYAPNPWGVHDMHGNVWELVEDIWQDTYHGAPLDGSAWTIGGDARRVVRGGSWINPTPDALRTVGRSMTQAHFRSDIIGFRIARTLAP